MGPDVMFSASKVCIGKPDGVPIVGGEFSRYTTQAHAEKGVYI